MNDCGVVQDLLPLYADGAASGDTVKYIRRHLAECSACREALRRVKREAEAGIPKVAVEPEELRFLEINRKSFRESFFFPEFVFTSLASFPAFGKASNQSSALT